MYKEVEEKREGVIPLYREVAPLYKEHGSRLQSALEPSQKVVIVGVRPDPEPDDLLAASDSQSAVMKPDPDRVDRLRGMNLPKAEPRVVGILAEETVRLAGMPPHSGRQAFEGGAEPLRCL